MSSSKKIFYDENLNTEFNTNGFIKLKLLNTDEIKEIKSALNTYYLSRSDLGETLSISLWSDNLELKKYADKLIKSYFTKKLESLLIDYEPLWGDVIIKKPHLTKTFGLHQDWTFVDEDIYTSINVWCPLQNVNYWNGSLQVIPKSHLLLDKIRGLNIIPSYSAIIAEMTKKYAVTIKAGMGEAILFSHALLHASSPNRTFKNRVTVGLNLKPKNSPVYHFIRNYNADKIEKYTVDKSYFINMGQNTNFKESIQNGFIEYRVDGELIETIEINKKKLNMTEIIQLFEKNKQ